MKPSRINKRMIAFVIGLLASIGFSIMVGLSSYHIALYTGGGGYKNSYISDEVYYVDSARRILVHVFAYSGHLYPYSGNTNPNYYNFEHPPLAKYIIGLSMALIGDKPINWRIPSIVMASLIPLIIYLGLSWNRGYKWISLGVFAALAASSDKILITMGSLAMLDIYPAFFLAIAIVLASRKRLLLSALFVGLASSAKETGLFGFLALVFLSFSLYANKKVAMKKIGEIVLIIIGVIFVVYVPLFAHFGFLQVLHETINGYKWDLQSRPPGPPTSNPSGWIINANPFILSYSPLLLAETSSIIEVPAMVSAFSIFISCILYKRKHCVNAGSIFYVFIFIGFWLVYLAGNHTLYSFYSIIFTPAAAVSLAEGVNLVIGGSNGSVKIDNNAV